MLLRFFLGMLSFFLLSGVYAQEKVKVLASVFPMYVLAQEILQDSQAFELEVLLPSNLGCPHGYALSPHDLKKISQTKVFLVNGLGLEEFLEDLQKQVSSQTLVIEASLGISQKEWIKQKHDHHDSAKKHHHEEFYNSHAFASPQKMAQMALYVAEQLGKKVPLEKDLLIKNAQNFSQRLLNIQEEMKNFLQKVPQKQIVVQHSAFDYFAKDVGLKIVGLIQEDDEHEVSPASLKALSKLVKAQKVVAIFTEPQYPTRHGEVLAQEVKLPLGVLDPVASGPEKVEKGYYEKVMTKNLEELKRIFSISK